MPKRANFTSVKIQDGGGHHIEVLKVLRPQKYRTIMHPIMEYTCPVWHPSLTTAHAKPPETLQKRAMNIIFPGMDYRLSLIMAGVDTLDDRREALTERFSKRSVILETSCLKFTIPTARKKRLCHCK